MGKWVVIGISTNWCKYFSYCAVLVVFVGNLGNAGITQGISLN